MGRDWLMNKLSTQLSNHFLYLAFDTSKKSSKKYIQGYSSTNKNFAVRCTTRQRSQTKLCSSKPFKISWKIRIIIKANCFLSAKLYYDIVFYLHLIYKSWLNLIDCLWHSSTAASDQPSTTLKVIITVLAKISLKVSLVVCKPKIFRVTNEKRNKPLL